MKWGTEHIHFSWSRGASAGIANRAHVVHKIKKARKKNVLVSIGLAEWAGRLNDHACNILVHNIHASDC